MVARHRNLQQGAYIAEREFRRIRDRHHRCILQGRRSSVPGLFCRKRQGNRLDAQSGNESRRIDGDVAVTCAVSGENGPSGPSSCRQLIEEHIRFFVHEDTDSIVLRPQHLGRAVDLRCQRRPGHRSGADSRRQVVSLRLKGKLHIGKAGARQQRKHRNTEKDSQISHGLTSLWGFRYYNPHCRRRLRHPGLVSGSHRPFLKRNYPHSSRHSPRLRGYAAIRNAAAR